MKTTDTPTEESWDLALEAEDVDRWHSGSAASMQTTLYGFTVETLIQRRRTGGSKHTYYRSRLVRKETGAITWDAGKFRNRSGNEDYTHEAINLQYTLDLQLKP